MKGILFAGCIVGVVACSDAISPTLGSNADLTPSTTESSGSGTSTVVVNPLGMHGWLFYNDEIPEGIDASLGSFVTGPGTPTYGTGSAQISVTGTQRRNLATYQFAGTALSDITTLKFSTYNPTEGNGGSASRSAYLNFNVDFNGSDTWQRRLVFVPSQNGTVVQNTWQEWDAIDGGNAHWSLSGGNWPGTAVAGTTLKTWADILSQYSGVRIRVSDAFLGLRVGEPYADGYTENIDSFTFGTAAGTTIFDFDDTSCHFTTDASSTPVVITLTGNCETSQSILIGNNTTLNGAGYTITAINPSGSSFSGAVIRNNIDADNVGVTNVTVTTAGLTGSSGDLSGIMLFDANGTINNNVISEIRRTGNSGSQEGNAIYVRNTAAPNAVVTISGNTISAYQKTGVVVRDFVTATITGNTVTGLGPIDYIAQNGIQVSYGATATVKGNAVSGNNYTPKAWVSCGILLYQAGGVKSSANNLSANEINQCNVGKGGGNVKATN